MRCVQLSALISPSNVSIAEQSIMNNQVGNELERRRQEIFARCGTSSTATAKEKVCVKRKQLQPILLDIVYRFSVDELKQIATTAGVRVPSFHELLEKLNHQVSLNLLIVTSSFFLKTLEN